MPDCRESGTGRTPTIAEMVGRARDMVPTLRERAARAEEMRTLPPETNREFIEAGFYRILQPARFGGLEMDYVTMVAVAAELARGCGSSSWVFANLASHQRNNGMRNPETQAELWADNPDCVNSTSFPTAAATATRVDGGVVIDGDWSFASGVDFADWNDFSIFLPRGEGEPPEHHFAMVPAADYEIVDDWHVTGLCGTGSKTTRVREVFVPQHRLLRSELCRGGPTEGSVINPHPLFRMPIWSLSSSLFMGPVTGLARGALEFVRDELDTRISSARVKVADQPTVQLRYAEADAEVEAAWSLVYHDSVEAMDFARAGAAPPLERRIRWRRNGAFAATLCVRAVDRLYPLVGSRGLAVDSPFQRAWRDIHAAASQITLVWDVQGTNFGRVALGLPSLDPRI